MGRKRISLPRWLQAALVLFLAVLVFAIFGSSGAGSVVLCSPLLFMPLYLLIVFICLILYLWTLLSILLSKKLDAGSRIAWILVLLVLPGLGLVIWLLFGPRK